MKSSTPPTPPIIPYQSPQLRLPRKTKLANIYAILSLLALLFILPGLLPRSHGPGPLDGVIYIVITAVTFGVSLFALRFAQLPYRIIAAIPFLICTIIFGIILFSFITNFSRNWEDMDFFWRYRFWSYNFWHQ